VALHHRAQVSGRKLGIQELAMARISEKKRGQRKRQQERLAPPTRRTDQKNRSQGNRRGLEGDAPGHHRERLPEQQGEGRDEQPGRRMNSLSYGRPSPLQAHS